MTYPGLFNHYQPIRGKDWIRRVEPEDRAVFVNIGHQEADYGRKGGRATVKRHGKAHMKKIARIGAIVTNSWKEWNRALREETERELGVTFDF